MSYSIIDSLNTCHVQFNTFQYFLSTNLFNRSQLPKPFSYFLADGFEIRLSSRLSRMFVIGFWLKIFIRTLSWHGIKPYKKIFYWTSTYLWHSRRTSSYEWHLKAFSWNSSILSLQPPRLKAALTLPITANTLPSVPVSLQIGLDVLVGILSPKSN